MLPIFSTTTTHHHHQEGTTSAALTAPEGTTTSRPHTPSTTEPNTVQPSVIPLPIPQRSCFYPVLAAAAYITVTQTTVYAPTLGAHHPPRISPPSDPTSHIKRPHLRVCGQTLVGDRISTRRMLIADAWAKCTDLKHKPYTYPCQLISHTQVILYGRKYWPDLVSAPQLKPSPQGLRQPGSFNVQSSSTLQFPSSSRQPQSSRSQLSLAATLPPT